MKIRQSSLLYRFAKWQDPSAKPFKNGCALLISLFISLFIAGLILATAVMFTSVFGLIWITATNGEVAEAGLNRLLSAFLTGLPFSVTLGALGWIVKKWCDNVTVVITKKS